MPWASVAPCGCGPQSNCFLAPGDLITERFPVDNLGQIEGSVSDVERSEG